MTALPLEFRAEPEAGLAAGVDGLTVINAILERLPQWLAAKGLLVAEVGASAPALMARHAALEFIWPDLPSGGEGVFLLEAAGLTSHTSRRR
jgi:ribosomal protein L3 glutamine methyltransferase